MLRNVLVMNDIQSEGIPFIYVDIAKSLYGQGHLNFGQCIDLN